MVRKTKKTKTQNKVDQRDPILDEGDKILQEIRAEYAKEILRKPQPDNIAKSAVQLRRDTQDTLNKVIQKLENKAMNLTAEGMAKYYKKYESSLKDFRHTCFRNHVNPRLLNQFDNIINKFNKPPEQIHQERLQAKVDKVVSYLEDKARMLSPEEKERYIEKHHAKLNQLQVQCVQEGLHEDKLRKVIAEKFETPIKQWKEEKKTNIRQDKWQKFNKATASDSSKSQVNAKLQEMRANKVVKQERKETKEPEKIPTLKPGRFTAGG